MFQIHELFLEKQWTFSKVGELLFNFVFLKSMNFFHFFELFLKIHELFSSLKKCTQIHKLFFKSNDRFSYLWTFLKNWWTFVKSRNLFQIHELFSYSQTFYYFTNFFRNTWRFLFTKFGNLTKETRWIFPKTWNQQTKEEQKNCEHD